MRKSAPAPAVKSAPRSKSAPAKGAPDKSALASAVDATLSLTSAPAPQAPPAPVPLANRTGAEILSVLRDYASSTFAPVVGALLSCCAGNVDRARAALGTDSPILPLLAIGAEILSVLKKSAPADFFSGDYVNAYGVRIGDLYASALGMSALYRSENREAIKAARTAVRPLLVK